MAQTLRCLIVDDHQLMRQMVIQNLNDINLKDYECAVNGYDAYVKLEEGCNAGRPYNIVFLDWNMPVMDGVELLKKCRADKKYDCTAIVMVTAESEQKMVVQAIKEGATSYICKPFSAEQLKGKIKDICKWLDAKKQQVK